MKYGSVPSRNNSRFNSHFQHETVPVDSAVGANLLRARNDLQVAIGEDVARKRAGTKDILGAETAKYLQHKPEMDHAAENLHNDYRANYVSDNMNALLK